MNRSKAAILIVGILGFACSQPLEKNLQSFTNEVFPDLDITTIQNLETPYESTFNNAGGKSNRNVVNLSDISTKLGDIFPDAEIRS